MQNETLTNVFWGVFLVWFGLLADTILYATASGLVIRAPGAIRRLHRRRAGRCVRCAYDLRGLPAGAQCPECGHQQRYRGG